MATTVFSLVANPGTTDARVMKQARALAQAGYDVHVFGRSEKRLPLRENVDGIKVSRFDCYAFSEFAERDLLLFDAIAGDLPSILAEPTRNFLTTIELLKEATKQRRDAVRLELIARKSKNDFSIRERLKKLHIKSLWLYWLRALRSSKNIPNDYNSIVHFMEGKKLRELELREQQNDHFFFLRHALFAINLTRVSFKERPDIIHAHDLYTLPAAVVLGAKTGAKVIYDAHELEIERVPPLDPERKAFIDTLERAFLMHVEHTVTVCKSIADIYKERAGGPVTVVMNAPESPASDGRSEVPDIRDLAGVESDTPLAVYTGGIGREPRGLHKVLAALQSCPGVHLVILGPRHQSNDAWLTGLAGELGLTDRVHLIPGVPATQVVEVIRSANLAVCPIQDVSLSYRFSMPNKLFEAAYASLPICVSNLPEMAAFVERLGIGIVMDQTSAESIAETIMTILANPSAYAPSQQAQEILKREYSWAQQAESLLTVYRSFDRVAA